MTHIARAADGSMRDAMSLTDQAISFGGGKVEEADVGAMLGSIDRNFVYTIVEALSKEDATVLLQAVAEIAEKSPDYSAVLAELLAVLHGMAVGQLVPEAVDDSQGDRETILNYAAQFAPEQLQLLYQTALLGRRDLPLAPDARSGFEMVLLRMLTFKPQMLLDVGKENPAGKLSSPVKKATGQVPKVDAGSHLAQLKEVLHQSSVPVAKKLPEPLQDKEIKPKEPSGLEGDLPSNTGPEVIAKERPVKEAVKNAVNFTQDRVTLGDEWADLLVQLTLSGPVRNFARNCTLENKEQSMWFLTISPKFEALVKEQNCKLLEQAISDHSGHLVSIKVELKEPTKPTPDQLLAEYKAGRKQEAIKLMQADPFIQEISTLFGASLDVQSVVPIDD